MPSATYRHLAAHTLVWRPTQARDILTLTCGRPPEKVVRLGHRVLKAAQGGNSKAFSELVSADAIAQMLEGNVCVLRRHGTPETFGLSIVFQQSYSSSMPAHGGRSVVSSGIRESE